MLILDSSELLAVAMRIITILAPIVLIVLAGFWYGRRHDPEMSVVNRINMDVFVPSLILGAMAGENFEALEYVGLASAAAVIVLLSGVAARIASRWIQIEWRTFVPPMMFNNSANIGIPLAVLAWGEAALPAAIVLYSVSNVLHFSLGIRMLDRTAGLSTLWKTPTLLAIAAGLTVSLLDFRLWTPLVNALQMLGNVAVPLLLFALGVRMKQAQFRGIGVPVLGAFAKPMFGALLAWLLAWLLSLSERDTAMLIVF